MMTQATFHVGDVRQVLTGIETDSVDLVMTSSPFLALRSYLPPDHPNKPLEIGSEPTPGTFVDVLCGVVDDLARVLAPHGSMVFELGDTYSGSRAGGGDYASGGFRGGQQRPFGSKRNGAGWPRNKSLALVPELFRIALAYGHNPITGRVWWDGDERWMVRNVVRWVRPNPPVGALGDKFRPATSDMVVFTRDPKRYFDLDAVRGPSVEPRTTKVDSASANKGISGGDSGNPDKERQVANPAGAPPLDWWEISNSVYTEAHYATYPPELCVIPVKSMCPQKVCRICGEPSRRIMETDPNEPLMSEEEWAAIKDARHKERQGLGATGTRHTQRRPAPDDTFSDCGHDDWRPGHVLDPFAGTGTTLAVATGHSRDATGIDLDERNADLALDRVGPLMLTIIPPNLDTVSTNKER